MRLPDGSVVKESAYNAGDMGDSVLIPGSGRSPGGGNATHSSILAWKIRWTEEPGGLQPMESQRVEHNQMTNTFTFTFTFDLQLYVVPVTQHSDLIFLYISKSEIEYRG